MAPWTAHSISAASDPKQPIATFDVARFANAPTTGETLFPKNTISYVTSPNFAATMEKLDTALSGVQKILESEEEEHDAGVDVGGEGAAPEA